MKIVFMGTPDIAVSPLEALIEAGHEIVCVITREDKVRGRSGELTPTPVKSAALKHGLKVIHPPKLKDEKFLSDMRSLDADVFVVVAYGRILPKALLDIPKMGCINIHASLLPKLRGAAPIQWAVIDGLEETGITTMLMDEGLDTGDILKQYKIRISDDETGGSLFDRLASLAGEAIVDTIDLLERGSIIPRKQGEQDGHYASMLTKEDGNIDWSQNSVTIERKIRGLDPWPSAYTFLNGKMVKIWKAQISESDSADEAGTIIQNDGKVLTVKTGDGALNILELQIEGKKRMKTDALLRGFRIETGSIFTSL